MNDQTVTASVPFVIRMRGERKLIVTPDGSVEPLTARVGPDSALLNALARGFRWQRYRDGRCSGSCRVVSPGVV